MGAVVNALLRNWPWFVLTLAVAVSVHVVTVRLLPYAVMHVVLEKVGPMDTIRHGKRPDETSRAVVRPSPDLLYSTCPYDLAEGPLRVTAPVPQAPIGRYRVSTPTPTISSSRTTARRAPRWTSC